METGTLHQTELKSTFMSPLQLLEHWQGHRRLTRRVIEAFPERDFFELTIGGMRPFSTMVMEMIGMGVPVLKGAITRTWGSFEKHPVPKSKDEVLKIWDATTEKLNELFPQISPERFQEVDLAFGQWEGPIFWIISYSIDNEIHHRAQGYVYLRSLGIQPPFFWER